jgi:undecaprenol kinase
MAHPPRLRVVRTQDREPRRPQEIERLTRSVGYAWEGLNYVARTQPNWRIHLLAAVLVWIAAVALQVSPLELAVLALTVGGVLALEAMNTAVEAAIDAAGEQYTPLRKRAKDAAAGAVLVAACAAVVVGVSIFVPRIIALLRT